MVAYAALVITFLWFMFYCCLLLCIFGCFDVPIEDVKLVVWVWLFTVLILRGLGWCFSLFDLIYEFGLGGLIVFLLFALIVCWSRITCFELMLYWFCCLRFWFDAYCIVCYCLVLLYWLVLLVVLLMFSCLVGLALIGVVCLLFRLWCLQFAFLFALFLFVALLILLFAVCRDICCIDCISWCYYIGWFVCCTLMFVYLVELVLFVACLSSIWLWCL